MPVDHDGDAAIAELLDAVAIGVLVGRAVRSLREKQELRQDDLAKRAANFGLRWDRTVIARLEAGKRHVGLEELLLLALMFKVHPGELLPGDDLVVLSPAVALRAGLLRDVLAERRMPSTSVDFEAVLPQGPPIHGDAYVGPDGRLAVLPLGTVDAALRGPTGDAERKAAKRLGVDPYVVSLTAFRLWGKSLSDQRDAEVDSENPEDERSLRARRGHVTRRLVAELGAAIAAEAEASSPRRKR